MELVDAIVLGAGFSGIGASMQLLKRGRSFVMLEASEGIGGTWRQNTYPGVECDVPSHLYSFSFAPNPDWSKTYGTGAEIRKYLERCVQKSGLLRYLRLGARAVEAGWGDGRWEVRTEGGDEFAGRFLVSGLGGLHIPNVPDIPGLETFAGPWFHTARWRHDVDLTGRVGMIGTGATAVQAAPKVAKIASSFTLFQRSPIWVAPKLDEPYSEDDRHRFATDGRSMAEHRRELWRLWEETGVEAFRPGSRLNASFQALARRNIEEHVDDPDLVARLTPDFNVTCKRPTYSSSYYPMFNRPNFELITDPIVEVVPEGVVTTSGRIELDVLVLATGFAPFDITKQIQVHGEGGRSLADAWAEGVASFRSVMVSGFPNLFLLLGPNSAGLTSAVEMIEAGIEFALRSMDHVDATGVVGVQPTPDQVELFTNEVAELMTTTTVNQGCRSWWTASGAHALWPSSSVRFRTMLGEVAMDDLEPVTAG